MSKYLTSKKSLLAFSILSGLISANVMAAGSTPLAVKSGDTITNESMAAILGADASVVGNYRLALGADLFGNPVNRILVASDGSSIIDGLTLGSKDEKYKNFVYVSAPVSGGNAGFKNSEIYGSLLYYTYGSGKGDLTLDSSSINNGTLTLTGDPTKQAISDVFVKNSTFNYSGGTAINLYDTNFSDTLNKANLYLTNSKVNANDFLVSGVGSTVGALVAGDTGERNNTVNVKDSLLKGNVSVSSSQNRLNTLSVNLSGSTLNGNAAVSLVGDSVAIGSASSTINLVFKDNSVWSGKTLSNKGGASAALSNVLSINATLDTGSQWNVTGDSALTSLKLQNGGALNLSGNKVTTSSLSQDVGAAAGYINVGDIVGNESNGNLLVNGTANGHYHILAKSSGKNPLSGDIDGYAAMGNDKLPTQVVTYLAKSADGKDVSSATFDGAAEFGTYKYNTVVLPDASGQSHVQFQNSGELSNSASTALSLAAAPRDIAYQQSETLSKRLDASRRSGDEGGVWASYFGGKSRADLKSGAGYDMDTNGFMLGVDTGFKVDNGSWLAGVAFSSGSSDMTSLNSRADIDSYGAQGYVSRRFDNGIFVDTGVQFSHFTESGKVSMLDGQHAQADTGTNGYGLNVKLGYDYRNASGFFAEPYVKATAMTFDGMNYRLSNGMTVNSAGMNSLQGELGVNAGYTFDLPQKGAFVKPYINLAGVNEFANGNKVTLNETDTLNNSVDGAGVRVGAGVQMQMTQNLGGYVSVDYMNADKTERPWDAVVGVSYTW